MPWPAAPAADAAGRGTRDLQGGVGPGARGAAARRYRRGGEPVDGVRADRRAHRRHQLRRERPGAGGHGDLRIRSTEQVAGLTQAQAALKEATAREAEAQTRYERINDMYQRRVVAKATLDEASAARDAAVARLSAARAGLDAAREGVAYTEVRAPYSGVVTQKLVQVGRDGRARHAARWRSRRSTRCGSSSRSRRASSSRCARCARPPCTSTAGASKPPGSRSFPSAAAADQHVPRAHRAAEGRAGPCARHVRQGRARHRRGRPAAGAALPRSSSAARCAAVYVVGARRPRERCGRCGSVTCAATRSRSSPGSSPATRIALDPAAAAARGAPAGAEA